MKINKDKKCFTESYLKEDTAEVEKHDVSVTDEADPMPATPKDKLIIENALTKALDKSFRVAKRALSDEEFDVNANILVTGLPGSSKTATVKQWCKNNGCHLYYLDAKNPDINILTSGAGAIDKTDPEHPVTRTAYSAALNKLDKENTVLFLDELNRQTKEYLRGSLLTLVADRRVAGDDEDGFRYFPNLLFTIACTNPVDKERDKGAGELGDAEKRRFHYQIQFDSDPKTTESYFKGYYDDKLRWAAQDPKNPRFKERVKNYVFSQWLGNQVINYDNGISGPGELRFKYDTMADLATDDLKGAKIFCQSVLTEIFANAAGDVKEIKRDIKSQAISDKAKKMLIDIIDAVMKTMPPIETLIAIKAKELGIYLGDTKGASAIEPSSGVSKVKRWDKSVSGETAEEPVEAGEAEKRPGWTKSSDSRYISREGIPEDRIDDASKASSDVVKDIYAFLDEM